MRTFVGFCVVGPKWPIYPSRFLKTRFLVTNFSVPQYYDLSGGYRNGNVTPTKLLRRWVRVRVEKTLCTSGKCIAKLLNYIKLRDSNGLLINQLESKAVIFFLKSKITSQLHMFYFINVIFK